VTLDAFRISRSFPTEKQILQFDNYKNTDKEM